MGCVRKREKLGTLKLKYLNEEVLKKPLRLN